MGSHLSLAVSVTTLLVTVIYYYKMVVLTELTTEATLFNTLYAEYSTPQMTDALRSVEEFSHWSHLTSQQIACKSVDERLWDKKFDHEWQRVFHWYQKIVYFHRMGLMSDRFYTEFPGPIRARHFVQHVEPFALNACKLYEDKSCSEIFDYLRALYSLPPAEEIVCDSESPNKAAETPKEEL